jgi:hypothetical protein
MTVQTYCIFADDIRQEIGNKISLMGIYNRSMSLLEYPSQLSKFCITVLVSSPASQRFKVVKARINYGSAELTTIELPDHFVSSFWADVDKAIANGELAHDGRVTAHLNVILSPLQADAPGSLDVHSEIDGVVSLAGQLYFTTAPASPSPIPA